MVRIVHTADNHIGLSFNSFPGAVKEILLQERTDALSRIVTRANNAGAHFLVVAGDLFDHLNIPKKTTRAVAGIINEFAGNALILPGNHDHCGADGQKVWDEFCLHTKPHVHLLSSCRPAAFDVNEQQVIFYPAPCDARHSSEHRIGWVQDVEKHPDALHIGIAHGNVEGHGLDSEGRYFNMTTAGLQASSLDCWLLGHIHAAYPEQAPVSNPGYFYSGNHAPDDWAALRECGSWLLEFDAAKNLHAERWCDGGIRFHTLERALHSSADIAALQQEVASLPDASLVRFRLSGTLMEEDKDLLDGWLRSVEDGRFQMAVTSAYDIHTRITPDDIDRKYSRDTLPHRLLSGLAGNVGQDNGLALDLAYRLMTDLSTAR